MLSKSSNDIVLAARCSHSNGLPEIDWYRDRYEPYDHHNDYNPDDYTSDYEDDIDYGNHVWKLLNSVRYEPADDNSHCPDPRLGRISLEHYYAHKDVWRNTLLCHWLPFTHQRCQGMNHEYRQEVLAKMVEEKMEK